MTLLPMFFEQIDLGDNELAFKRMPNAFSYSSIDININGIKSKLWIEIKTYKLTRLICFFNPEGPRKPLKRQKFQKVNSIDSTSLDDRNHAAKLRYSHFEICVKFEHPGNYFIIILNLLQIGWFQFYVKIKKANKEKCVFKMFKKTSDLERKVLKSLRRYMMLNIAVTDVDDIEDGQMNVISNEDYIKKYPKDQFVASIAPSLMRGTYEFYLDEDGITKERPLTYRSPEN